MEFQWLPGFLFEGHTVSKNAAFMMNGKRKCQESPGKLVNKQRIADLVKIVFGCNIQSTDRVNSEVRKLIAVTFEVDFEKSRSWRVSSADIGSSSQIIM